jgi:hypothetical protein
MKTGKTVMWTEFQKSLHLKIHHLWPCPYPHQQGAVPLYYVLFISSQGRTHTGPLGNAMVKRNLPWFQIVGRKKAIADKMTNGKYCSSQILFLLLFPFFF